MQLITKSKAYVKELSTNSTFLQDINDDFTNVCGELRLFSFYETMKTDVCGGSVYVRGNFYDQIIYLTSIVGCRQRLGHTEPLKRNERAHGRRSSHCV
jgi:hypothetical protein